MQVWVGTSGYSFPDWVGTFYPGTMTPGRMLAYYAHHFPLVEVNYTFYRVPAGNDLERMAAKTPAGFKFTVKLHQSLTHEQDLREADAFRQALEPLQTRGRLLAVLAQFPQRFHWQSAHEEYLGQLAGRLQGTLLAVEFRHRSWARPSVLQRCAEKGMCVVSVDVPSIPSLFPAGLVQTCPTLYVRLHSRNADNWYGDEKTRYDYSYSDEELGEWIERLEKQAPLAQRALVLFNNCLRGQAAANARRMQELLRRRAHPLLEVIEPVTAQPPPGHLF
ncbi:MAG: DUF72 domain-containing protein [Gemmataceae bacterium]